jgi:hypothetical protein
MSYAQIVGAKNNFLANTSYVIARISGIKIQQTILPVHLENLSIDVIDVAIHLGISSGILSDPPLLSAIISSEISNLVGSSAINSLKKNKADCLSPLYYNFIYSLLKNYFYFNVAA